MSTADVLDGLVDPHQPVAIAIGEQGAAVAVAGHAGFSIPAPELASTLRHLEAIGPRWVWWSNATAIAMLDLGVRVARCWDLSAVHRLLVGGWTSGADRVWAFAHGLDVDAVPTVEPVDLFHQATEPDDPEHPIRPDGYLHPEWVTGEWATDPTRIERWAELALEVRTAQEAALARLADAPHAGAPRGPDRPRTTALSESAAELICAELEHDGLPFDCSIGEQIVAGFVGPR
ncbi:MAG: hypothetical protein WBV89_04050, partial [Ilumatobacter sp.]